MGTLDETTNLVELSVFMLVMGAGVGMLMQNLVLVVQNTVRFEDIGAGSSLIAFFRSLGGAIGVSVLGALLAHHASATIVEGLAAQGIKAAGSADKVPDVSSLPAPVAQVVEHAYGTGVGEIFLLAAPLGLVDARGDRADARGAARRQERDRHRPRAGRPPTTKELTADERRSGIPEARTSDRSASSPCTACWSRSTARPTPSSR